MKILLAGPGTGKTTKIKSIIKDDFSSANKIKVLSFTNFTVNDLSDSFRDNDSISCSTLHSFAFGLNHRKDLYVVTGPEQKILEKLSEKTEISLNNICDQLECVTFDGMIAASAAFVAANPVYAKEKIGELDLLLADEYQDFNPSEQALVKAVSEYATETIILGDDDQSIYGFKDADPSGIIDIHADADVEKLEHENICYRCPDEVVDHGTKLLAANKYRVAKEWKKNGNPGTVTIEQFATIDEENDYIHAKVLEIRAKQPNSSILILSPLDVLVDGLRDCFGEDNPDIVDCWKKPDEERRKRIWWMCAIFLEDNLKFLIFLLGTRRLAVNTKVIELLRDHLEKGVHPTHTVSELIAMKLFEKPLAPYLENRPNLDEFFRDNPEFDEMDDHIDRDNIERSLKSLSQKFNETVQFEKGKVNLMSIHKSKGLQAEYVFVLGLTAGILPNDEKGLDTIEAQRRLLFVAMTRASRELYLLSTITWLGKDLRPNNADMTQFQFRFMTKDYRGKASRFIEEIVK